MRITKTAIILAIGAVVFIFGLACTSEAVCTEDICTYNGQQPPYANAEGSGRMHLVNNPNAKDPTWQQLKTFILEDDTDRLYYVDPSFVSSDFAGQVHDNAESAGIKAAFVLIEYNSSSIGHALNAFNTTDMGLVYIDCTGGGLWEQEVVDLLPNGYDRIAYLEIDKEYGVRSLTVATDCLEYQCYENHSDIDEAKVGFDVIQQQCNEGWQTYAAHLEEYNGWLYDAYLNYPGDWLCEYYERQGPCSDALIRKFSYHSRTWWEDPLEAEKLDVDRKLELLDTQGNESYISKIYIQQQCNQKWETYTSDLEEYNDWLRGDELYYEPFGWSACNKPQYESQCVHAESKALELRIEKRALDTQLQSLDGQGHWLLELGYLWVWKPLGNVSHITIYW